MFKVGQRVYVIGGNGDVGTIEMLDDKKAFVSFANYQLDNLFDIDQLVDATDDYKAMISFHRRTEK